MKVSFFFLIFIFSCVKVFTQTSDYSDYLILNTGDTLFGDVQHIDRRKVSTEFYKKIRLTDSKGKERKYKRKDVSAFMEDKKLYEGFWLNQSSEKLVLFNPRYHVGTSDNERYFLKLITKGKLSHYEMEWFEQGDAAPSWMDLLKKEEDQYFIRATQGIFGLKRKTLVEYFQECPKLQKQIEDKTFKKVNQVVSYFNANCGM